MRILLAGYYGCGNVGDEALLQVLLTELRSKFPAEITVLSQNPASTSRHHGVHSVNKFFFFDVLRSLRSCDALVFGGGGLLQDATSRRSLLYYAGLIRLAKFFGKKVILLAQGIGPLKNKKPLKNILSHIDLLTVRDESSLKELKEIGAVPRRTVLTADLAFLLEPEAVEKEDGRSIGVSLRKTGKPFDASAVAKLCDHLVRDKGFRIVFIPFHADDIEAINRVKNSMTESSKVLSDIPSPSRMLGVISNLDVLIGMRLHSLIFAAKAGVPALGLSYDPKVSSFQRSVDMPFVDIGRLNLEELIRAADAVVENRPRGVPELTAAARRNIDLLLEALANDRIDFLGVEVGNVSMKEAFANAEAFIDSKQPHLIVTPNPEMIIASENDVELRHIINSASLAPADGVGLMIAARLLGKKFKQRVPGIDLMYRIIDEAKVKGDRIFLFGGTEGVAEKAAEKIGASVVGVFQGYSMNDRLVIEKIRESRPDILFVGLGSPKQEKWAAKHLKELGVPLVMCVGGSLDVISGKVKRAPKFMRNLGLEWLWRLMLEPWRIKRMLVLPLFLWKVIKTR